MNKNHFVIVKTYIFYLVLKYF